MKVAIIGFGSIGQRHYKNLLKLGISNIDIVDTNPQRNLYNLINFYYDYNLILNNKYDFVMICTPPSSHIPISIDFAKSKNNLFIEKPLSNSLDDINNLIAIIENNNLIVQVGYNLKFHGAVEYLKGLIDHSFIGKIYYLHAEFGQYLPDWRENIKYEDNYTAKSNLGGGIINDGSHELDTLLWFINEDIIDIKVLSNKISDLDIDVEDIAEMLLLFKSGAIGHIHLDMLNRKYKRNYSIMGANGGIEYSFENDEVSYYNSKTIKNKYLTSDPNESYIKELKYFIEHIKSNTCPVKNNIYSAYYTLSIIDKIKKSINE